MSVLVSELYDALRKIGVEDALARDAARAVFDLRSDLVTKADLRADLAELKSDLIKWQIGSTAAVLLGIFAVVVRLG